MTTMPISNSPVVNRRVITPKLPDWQYRLATTFLMTSDMSSTLDDIDLSDDNSNQITEDTTRCICNSTHESQVMIQCDCCKKWLHEYCIKLQNSREEDQFICIFCQEKLSRAVKEYIRKKLASFEPLVQKMSELITVQCKTDSEFVK